jgi:outer membrane protein assembly factor BamB
MSHRRTLARLSACLAYLALAVQAASAQDYVESEALKSMDLMKYWQVALPLAANQTVTDAYLVDDQIYLATNDGFVYAVHADTGAIRWTREITRNGYRVWRPCHAGDRVAFVTPSGIRQYDRQYGDPIREQRLRFPAGSPAVSDGKRLFLGGVDRRIYAFDVDWDFEIWKLRTGNQIIARPVLFGDGMLAVACDDGGVYACKAANKAMGWVTFTAGANSADLVADKAGVYVASRDNSLYLLDPGTGGKRWRVRMSGPLFEPPVVYGESVFQYCPSDGLVAINATGLTEDERIKWKLANGRSALALDGKKLFALTASQEIARVDAATGDVEHTAAAAGLTLFMPSPSDTAVFLASTDGRVFCARKRGAPPVRAGELRAAMRLKGEQAASQPAASTIRRAEPLVDLTPRPVGPPIGGKSKVSKAHAGEPVAEKRAEAKPAAAPAKPEPKKDEAEKDGGEKDAAKDSGTSKP